MSGNKVKYSETQMKIRKPVAEVLMPTVLDGLKAYLEHKIDLNLIGDKFPKDDAQHGN